MNTTLKNVALVAVSVAATAISTISLQAHAVLDANPGTSDLPQIIPYQGHLDLDGAPVNGLMEMRFSLYDQAQGGTAAWTEEWTADGDRLVSVYGGRFGVSLGAVNSVADLIADGGTLYLGIEVRNPAPDDNTPAGDWIPLSGRQRLNPVPFALWSAKSADMTVGGQLIVGGASQLRSGVTIANGATVTSGGLRVSAGGANITGDVAVTGNTTLTGNTTVTGNTSVGGTLTSGGNTTVGGNLIVNNTDFYLGANRATPGGRALVDQVATDRLFVNYEGDFTGGTYIQGGVQMLSTLAVSGATTFSSPVTVNGAMTVSGAISTQVGSLLLADSVSISGNLDDIDSDLNINDNLAVTGNLDVPNNSWGTCEWTAYTHGTTANGETLEAFCQNGWYAAGYRRWHGSHDYGIEDFTLYCCKL